MNLKQRVKTYKFWVALSAALIILIKALGQAFGFEITEQIIDNVVMGLCGVLVAVGVVDKPADANVKDNQTDDEPKNDIK